MKRPGIICVLLVIPCVALLPTGCTSSPATPPSTAPSASGASGRMKMMGAEGGR